MYAMSVSDILKNVVHKETQSATMNIFGKKILFSF